MTMTWQYTPFTFPLILTAVVSALLGFAMWQRRKVPGGTVGTLLMFAVAIWGMAYAFQVAGADFGTKLLWAKVRYIGISTLPPLFFIFALQFVGRGNLLSPRQQRLLFILPALTVVMVFTNEWHNQFWYEYRIEMADGMVDLVLKESAWFWVHTVYSYLLTAGGILLLLRGVIHAPNLYKKQRLVVAIASLTPLVANIITLALPGVFPLSDLTPFSFTVTGVAMTWGLFRFHFLELGPIARDQVFENMSDGVIVLDMQNRVLDINPAARQIFGYGEQDLIGVRAGTLFERWPHLVERYRDLMEVNADIEIAHSDGAHFYDLRISPLVERQGEHVGRLIVLRDISERKRALIIMEQAREEAESASRAKSAFLANMSHELRTPLTAIIGYSELVLEEANAETDEMLYHDVKQIETAGRHLLALVSSVLDLSKIEADEMKVDLESFELDELIHSVLGMVQPLLEKNRNQFVLQAADGLGEMQSDRMKVRQMLLNLLSNAAKFTERGTITLEVTRERNKLGEWLCFCVSDTGIGMSPQDAERLFQPFMQADSSPTRRYGGTGLGLTISRRFAQLLGGDITLKRTADGAGSAFLIMLPATVMLPASNGTPHPTSAPVGELAPRARDAA